MGSAVFMLIIVVIGAILIFFYLRKGTIKKYTGWLEEIKPIINGRWVKFGFILEGEYKERKVKCGIEEVGGIPLITLKMKPKEFFFANKKDEVEDVWIDWRWIDSKVSNKPEVSFVPHKSIKPEKMAFTNEVERLTQFCDKIERREILL